MADEASKIRSDAEAQFQPGLTKNSNDGAHSAEPRNLSKHGERDVSSDWDKKGMPPADLGEKDSKE